MVVAFKVAVVVFAYNRPDHLQKCLTALEACPEIVDYPLFIFVDGPKLQSDIENCNATATVAREFDKSKSVAVFESSNNLGVSISIKSGVSQLFQDYDACVVLEDDLVVSPTFLKFMISGLVKYRFSPKVVSVQASNYFANGLLNSAFFLQGADCWGWGTWRDRWNDVEWNVDVLLSRTKLKSEREVLDHKGAYSYIRMLKLVKLKIIDSWAIPWHVSAFISKKLSLYPNLSQVTNIGDDGSGTHMGLNTSYRTETTTLSEIILPDLLVESETARQALDNFLLVRKNSETLFTRTKYSIKLNIRIIEISLRRLFGR